MSESNGMKLMIESQASQTRVMATIERNYQDSILLHSTINHKANKEHRKI